MTSSVSSTPSTGRNLG
uniref:Uncharacterized protein n=1 Tax=Rhizophora mucronata TaxID=61149 RepID=A0A2P2IQ43_RHIMU